jgi:predicted DCC family thiol-disulfide oxidoreductase YuxK
MFADRHGRNVLRYDVPLAGAPTSSLSNLAQDGAVSERRGLPLLIFDGDCAFCTSSAMWLAERLRRKDGRNAQLVAWQFLDLAALGTSPQRAQREALWIATDGTISGGAAAFAAWLRFRGGLYGLAGSAMSLPGIRQLAAAVYRLIAKNRHRMPGGSPACALPPAGYDPTEPGTKAL